MMRLRRGPLNHADIFPGVEVHANSSADSAVSDPSLVTVFIAGRSGRRRTIVGLVLAQRVMLVAG
jgi:hypothetical protein